jgi:hypothetical protein
MGAAVVAAVLMVAPGMVNPRPVVNAPSTIIFAQGTTQTAASHHSGQ